MHSENIEQTNHPVPLDMDLQTPELHGDNYPNKVGCPKPSAFGLLQPAVYLRNCAVPWPRKTKAGAFLFISPRGAKYLRELLAFLFETLDNKLYTNITCLSRRRLQAADIDGEELGEYLSR
jgi:hypothetical protein